MTLLVLEIIAKGEEGREWIRKFPSNSKLSNDL